MFFIRKTRIKFDFTFFAVIALLIFIDTSGTAMLSLIASLLHETGHLVAILLCRAELQSIVFYGGGICIRSDLELLCFSKRLFIVSAGCMINLLISIIGFVFFQRSDAFLIFATVNGIICVFNLIPVGYFDGAEILDIIFSRLLSLRKKEILKKVIGIFFSVIVTLVIIFYCFFLKGTVSLSFLFVVLYLILAQFVC